MKFEFEKNLRIMSDLVTWCHKQGAYGYHIDMETVDGVAHIRIACTAKRVSSDALRELDVELNRPRQKEIEQNYWGLSGEMETGTEITLIGMMVDKAVITHEGGRLGIHCMRVQ